MTLAEAKIRIDDAEVLVLREVRHVLIKKGKVESGDLDKALQKLLEASALVERARVVGIMKEHWTFDENQQHTHTWHDKQDAIQKIQSHDI